MNGEHSDHVTALMPSETGDPTIPRRMPFATYLRASLYAREVGLRIVPLHDDPNGPDAPPAQPQAGDQFVLNREVPIEAVRAGATTDVRWRGVDSKKWVENSVAARFAA